MPHTRFSTLAASLAIGAALTLSACHSQSSTGGGDTNGAMSANDGSGAMADNAGAMSAGNGAMGDNAMSSGGNSAMAGNSMGSDSMASNSH
jgi:hypothetical protein